MIMFMHDRISKDTGMKKFIRNSLISLNMLHNRYPLYSSIHQFLTNFLTDKDNKDKRSPPTIKVNILYYHSR